MDTEYHETDILDCKIAELNTESASRLIFERIEKGLKTKAYFINAHKMYLMEQNEDFARIISEGDLRLADGHSILWAANKLKMPLAHKTTGIELLQCLLKNAGVSVCRAFFIGGDKNTIIWAYKNAFKKYGDAIAGFHYGYFSPEENEAIIKKINDTGAQLLFAGFGSPKQERWLHENARLLKPLLLMGVGGSFDILSGEKKRAPGFFIGHGLEWLWRFFQSPVKMARRVFLENIHFVVRVYKEVLKRKSYRG